MKQAGEQLSVQGRIAYDFNLVLDLGNPTPDGHSLQEAHSARSNMT